LIQKLEDCNTVTISSVEPFLKTALVLELVRRVLALRSAVQYIDLDLQFSSLVRYAGSTESQRLLTPDISNVRDELTSFIAEQREKKLGSGKTRALIVLDSMNTFQDLLVETPMERDPIRSNREAFLYVTLLQQAAKWTDSMVVVTNILRARPEESNGRTSWTKHLVGGRMMTYKSDAVVFLNKSSKRRTDASDDIALLARVTKASKGRGGESEDVLVSVPVMGKK
jgi:hypothetical protein